ncbi:MAG: terminase large subunit domain-containing protein [Butyricicoccus sp.]
MELSVTARQMEFIRSEAFETLFGGAAGGGKSYAQLIDALVFALQYPKSRQLMLRRTFPELRRSLIQVSLSLYPKECAEYRESKHIWEFTNGSTMEFGFCDNEGDVTKYQSAEYDVIRFDELTHFTEFQFTYLLSRIRGANGYPKQVKSSTNPGGVGHHWVKERYIDRLIPGQESGGRLFLPAKVQDNCFLMGSDPDYVKRLEMLDQKSRRALLNGEWNLFEGQYFSEFSPDIHVEEPPTFPSDWRRYLAIDYGLDMLAALWIALDGYGTAWVYREVYQSGLVISEAAQQILLAEEPGENIDQRFAPPDLFARRQETGRSAVEIFAEHGLYFDRAAGDRVQGWYALKEYLHPFRGEQGAITARLKIAPRCRNLIRTLPAVQYDANRPNDVATQPHELTHAPDALRYFAATIRPEGMPTVENQLDSDMDAFLAYGNG